MALCDPGSGLLNLLLHRCGPVLGPSVNRLNDFFECSGTRYERGCFQLCQRSGDLPTQVVMARTEGQANAGFGRRSPLHFWSNAWLGSKERCRSDPIFI